MRLIALASVSSLAWYSSSVFGAYRLGGLNKFSRFHAPIRTTMTHNPSAEALMDLALHPGRGYIYSRGAPQNHAPFTKRLQWNRGELHADTEGGLDPNQWIGDELSFGDRPHRVITEIDDETSKCLRTRLVSGYLDDESVARHRANAARTRTDHDLAKQWAHLTERARQRKVEAAGRAAVADLYE